MNGKYVADKLRAILDRVDIDRDGLINRKKSSKHGSDIEVLLEHVSILVKDLKFDADATRRELFEIRSMLE